MSLVENDATFNQMTVIDQVARNYFEKADEIAKINEDAGEVLLLPKTVVKKQN
jgi:hypothetical protein